MSQFHVWHLSHFQDCWEAPWGPTGAADEEDVTKRVTMVRNYSWSDDTNVIKVYVPVPGVVRSEVTVEFGDTTVDFIAKTPMYGTFTMALRRLYDSVDVSKSSYKVLEKKEKVIISLAKFPPADYGTSSYIDYKPWYQLHYGSNDAQTAQITEAMEKERLQKIVRMNEAAKPPPIKQPEVKRRE